MNEQAAISRRKSISLARLAGAIALAMSLGACSTVGDFFSGEDSKAPPPAAQAKGDDKSAPKLSTVPDRPKPQTTAAQRQNISQGLKSDKDNARYGGDVAAQDENGNAQLGTRLAGSPPPAQAPAPAGGGGVVKAPAVAGSPAPQQAALPPASMPSPNYGDIGFAGRGSSLQIAVIQFGRGSAGLTGEDRGVLRDVAAIHKRNGGTVRVMAYSEDDTTGASVQAKVNAFAIANGRANAVAAELIRQGVPRDRVQVQAFGDETAAPTGPAQAAAARRADVFIDF